VLDPGRKRTKTGYFWAIVSDDRGHGGPSPPIVLFHYAPGRGGIHAETFLSGYGGRFLQCDGYEAYDRMTGVERAQGPWVLVHCWSHVRRRFVKLMRNQGSPIAEEAVRQIALLYGVESTVRGMAPGVRLAARRELSAPVVTALKTWFEAQLSRVPKGSQIATDIRYALGLWSGLTRFLDDGRLELDTNPVENQIRPLASDAAICSSDQRPAMLRITAKASSAVAQPCSPVRGLRTRSSECWPPRQWMVSTTSRAASSTSTTICRDQGPQQLLSRTHGHMGAFQAADRFSARSAKAPRVDLDRFELPAGWRACRSRTRRSAASQFFSSWAAISRLSGSQAA
jgi:hypothetical protein